MRRGSPGTTAVTALRPQIRRSATASIDEAGNEIWIGTFWLGRLTGRIGAEVGSMAGVESTPIKMGLERQSRPPISGARCVSACRSSRRSGRRRCGSGWPSAGDVVGNDLALGDRLAGVVHAALLNHLAVVGARERRQRRTDRLDQAGPRNQRKRNRNAGSLPSGSPDIVTSIGSPQAIA